MLTLSRHSSLSLIALGRSSGQHPVSSHSCWMYVRAGRPAFARPCVGIHKSTSLMSSSLLLQQCPACLVRLTWIVFVIGGRWPYSWCLVGCCCHCGYTKWQQIKQTATGLNIIFVVVEKNKCEISVRMCNVYGEKRSSEKTFTNGLNMNFPPGTWIEKTLYGVETYWPFGKERSLEQRSVKNVMFTVFSARERSITINLI